jgi:hypothetical protein
MVIERHHSLEKATSVERVRKFELFAIEVMAEFVAKGKKESPERYRLPVDGCLHPYPYQVFPRLIVAQKFSSAYHPHLICLSVFPIDFAWG